MLAKKLSPFIPTTEETLILPNLRKRKTLQSAKITTLSKIHIQLCRTFSFALFFDFRYFSCGGCHNPKPCIAHIVEQRVKLPPFCIFSGGLVQKELVYGYIVTEHKLKENLQTGVLSIIFDIRKVAWRNKHFIAYFLAALFPTCPRCLYCRSKSLEVVFWYWSFCHIHSPSYILLFLFSSGYAYTIPTIN